MAIFLVCLLFAASNARSALAQEVDVESAVCGSIREPFMFWLWSSMAGSPNPKRVSQIKDLEQISFKTRDITELGGYKLAATNPKGSLGFVAASLYPPNSVMSRVLKLICSRSFICETRFGFGDPAILLHSQNMNGSRIEPQTALSTSTSCAKADLALLAANSRHTRNIAIVLATENHSRHRDELDTHRLEPSG